MERIDLELYADRLARHADRLADEVSAARTRIAWSTLEARARSRLEPADVRTLIEVGVLADPSAVGGDARDVLERRRRELAALGRLQAVVEGELAAARGRAALG